MYPLPLVYLSAIVLFRRFKRDENYKIFLTQHNIDYNHLSFLYKLLPYLFIYFNKNKKI